MSWSSLVRPNRAHFPNQAHARQLSISPPDSSPWAQTRIPVRPPWLGVASLTVPEIDPVPGARHRRLTEQCTEGRHRLPLACRPRPESGDGHETQAYSQSRTDPKLAHQPVGKFASRKPDSQAVRGPFGQAL
jgi:hypothetical protein